MAIMAQKRALRNYRTRLVKRGMAFAEDDDFLWSIRRFHGVMSVHPLGLGLHTRTHGDVRCKHPP
jgi:hypothetical protein